MDLSSLNPPQREAVEHADGPLVVFAGAGSGKTRVITYRIAHLLERGVKPWRILAVTFTNKAAAEMRERMLQLVPDAEGLWIGTFHSICARLLRRHAEIAGVHPNFVIYDDTDRKAMLTRVLRDLGVDERRFTPRDLGGRIDRAKQELKGPDDLDGGDYYADIVQRVYATYEERMQRCGALDFGDLLYRMVLAMRNHEALRHTLQQQWSYILVDEFQDTNLVQLELVRLLAAEHRNLCVVGDDDQSIYKWRGADRRNILDFRDSFGDAQVVKLEQNYRSSQHILAAATSVIARNVEREPKTLWTDNDPGDPIMVVACGDERDEARAISEAIRMLRDHGHELSDMAIFYRTHSLSRVLEEEMRACNLPYKVIGGMRFYERAEVKDVLAYLRATVNPDDDVSLMRVINTPIRGIGKTTQEKLLNRAASGGISVWNALAEALQQGEFARGTAAKLGNFKKLIDGFREQAAAGAGPATLAEAILADTGYLQGLRDQDNAEADGRIENIEELLGSLREFEAEAEQPTLEAYLELVTLQTNADEVDAAVHVTLMTVHAAKGLEFPIVWVAGLEERLFPLSRDEVIDPDDMEEERRLAYVAFTRAEKRLFLSHCSRRMLYGRPQMGLPSRFVDEIPAEHCRQVERPARRGSYGGGDWSGQRSYGQRNGQARTGVGRNGGFMGQRRSAAPKPARRVPPGESYVDTSEGDLDAQLSRGSNVRHAKFGVGVIVGVEPGMPPRVTVDFPGWGTKQIVARYLEPA